MTSLGDRWRYPTSGDLSLSRSFQRIPFIGSGFERGPTGMMLAGKLALAGADEGTVERRASQDRTIEVFDQR